MVQGKTLLLRGAGRLEKGWDQADSAELHRLFIHCFSLLFHSLHSCSSQTLCHEKLHVPSLPLLPALSCGFLHPSLLGSMILLSRISKRMTITPITSAFNGFFPFVFYSSGRLKMGKLESAIQGVGSSGTLS